MSAKQKAAVRAQLRKAIKKNPAAIKRKSFLRKASLVNFKLPITVRLRTGDAPGTPANEAAVANPNRATIDLGASLGQREVNLGGKLAGEITFHDSYDGGALGNVDLELRGTKALTSTSIPLLWNTDVSNAASRYDAPFFPTAGLTSGCGNWLGSSNLNFGVGILDANGIPGPPAGPSPGPFVGAPGFPFHSAANVGGLAEGFLPIDPGVDSLDAISTPNKTPGDPNALGGNPDPFPTTNAYADPYGAGPNPNLKDTVLRTAPLSLSIAPTGTEVQNGNNLNGVSGSQNIVIGKSGGVANLFGNIPGKSTGIDVTVSLATKINSIFRIVDQDPTGAPLVEGEDWPAGVFNCRQVYSGGVQNYIPGVKLNGSLKISPAITADGHLRIAKATLASQPNSPARFAVAACLMPFASYNKPQNGSDNYPLSGAALVPPPTGGVQSTADLPSDVDSLRSGADLAAVTNANCNDMPTGLVRQSAMNPFEVTPLTPAGANYTVANSGSTVSVAADLTVNTVVADVLIGDV
jgi:hypothetical protein